MSLGTGSAIESNENRHIIDRFFTLKASFLDTVSSLLGLCDLGPPKLACKLIKIFHTKEVIIPTLNMIFGRVTSAVDADAVQALRGKLLAFADYM